MSTQIVLLIGSNSGNKFQMLQEAVTRLQTLGKLIASSSLYETEPWGFECNENFINQAVILETSLSPFEFLEHSLNIEQQLGRIRNSNSPRYTSRTIDIDIIFYGTQIINTPTLTVPHPRMQERNFVLSPLAEIIPNFKHPVFQQTINSLLSTCPDQSAVKKIT